MAANRSAYILEQVRTVLATDATINVIKVWKADFRDGIVAYPFILNQTFTSVWENGYNTGEGIAQVNILFHDKTQADPSGAGINTDAYGEIVAKVEKLFADCVVPRYEAHTGNVFATTIHDMRITSWDGQFDIGDTKVNIGCLLEVQFTHQRL